MAKSSGGFRKLLNGSPVVSIGIIVVILGIAAAIWTSTRPVVYHGNYYYTIDNGKTYFAGPLQVTPFTHDGKEAVEAHVFKCGDRTFVAYLLRYPEKVHARMAKQLAQAQPGQFPPAEVKRPEDTEWVAQNAPSAGPVAAKGDHALTAAEIMQPKCEDGKFAVPLSPKQ